MDTRNFKNEQLRARICAALQNTFGPNAAVRTDIGEAGLLYVRIVSDRFDGLNERGKQDLVWDTLRLELRDEAKSVALVKAIGTEQI